MHLFRKMITSGLYFIVLTALFSSCNAYKALVIYPIPSRSHANLGDAVVKQLLKEGHEVTYIRCYEYKNPPSNLRQIDVSDSGAALMANSTDRLDIKKIMETKDSMNDHTIMKLGAIKLVANVIGNKAVQELLNDRKEHFDVVIVEWMFTELFSGLAALYQCPLIWMCPIEVNNAILSVVDASPNPAYNADILSSNIAPFTFRQRIEELWVKLKLDYLDYMYFTPMETEEYNKQIVPLIMKRGLQPPPYHVVKYNVSLVMGNSHAATGQANVVPQSYKHIGGYHIDENIKPLPEDLKKIMDRAKNGVIYFSMGSNLKSKDWPEDIKQSLLEMFGELKQTVLWKFEEDLPYVPKNVHILKWAPQPSILSHKNCLIFISHGGGLSTMETIHFGVPIIGIPVFGDQFMNVRKAVKKGFALQVDLTYSVAEDLKMAIEEMLSNAMYTNRVKELSFIYHDRPMKPAQELGHWVRHVIETRGAAHLRSPGIEVPFYQRLYLDLLAIVILILIFILYVLRSVYCRVCRKKNLVNSKKNN